MERTVTVRLKALIGEYQAAMRKASGDTSAFSRAAQGEFAALGGKMKDLGDGMTRRLTLPLAAAAVGAVKLGSDFETTFSRMVGLANVPADEIERLRKGVLDLAGETTRSPQELAEALYFINSSGIAAADSLGVLRSAARASAAGLGDTVAIADAVTSAINAYGAENISATQATDILVAAVREGKIEAGELAPVMGRLIPLGAKLGISFDDIAGVLAIMSRTGLDAAEASTSLNAVMSTLLGTSKEGEQVLADHGLSLGQLRRVASGPDGIINVMRMLDDAFGGNLETLEQVIPNIRAMRGFMNVLAQDAGGVDDVMRKVTDSVGATDQAFGAFRGSKAAELKQAWVDIQIGLIRVYEIIAPLAASAANLIGVLVDGFTALPGPVQQLVVGFAVLVASMGPVLKIGGYLLENMKTLAAVGSKALDKIALGAYSAAGSLKTIGLYAGVAGAAIGILAVHWWKTEQANREAEERVDGYVQAIREAGDVAIGVEKRLADMATAGEFSDEVLEQIAAAGLTVEELGKAALAGDDQVRALVASLEAARMPDKVRKEMDMLGVTVEDVIDAVADGDHAIAAFGTAAPTMKTQEWAKALEKTAIPLVRVTDEAAKAEHRAGLLGAVVGDSGDQADVAAGGFDNLAASTAAAAATQKFLTDSMNATFAAMFGGEKRALGVDAAFAQFNDTMTTTDTTSSRAGRGVDLVAEKQKRLTAATKDVDRAFESLTSSFEDIEDAQKRLAEAQTSLDEALRGPSERDSAEAKNAQTRAELELVDAKERRADAEQAVVDAEAAGDTDEIASARRDLTRAELDLEAATWRAEDATAAYSAVANWSAETDRKVADARDGVTDAQSRLEKATRDSAKRYGELGEAQRAQAEVQNAALSTFGAAETATARIRDRALEARGAYDQLTDAVKGSVAELLTLAVTDARGAQGELDRLRNVVMTNPNLSDKQRGDLLKYLDAVKLSNPDARKDFYAGLSKQIRGYDTGGLVGGPMGSAQLALVHGGETILPTHKRSMDKIMSSGMFGATGGSSSGAASRSGLTIETAHFGDRRVVRDLDLWARSQGAAV